MTGGYVDDREMFARLRERGPKALLAQRRVYDHYAPLFFAFLRRRRVPEEDRQDIVQQTFLKAFMSVDQILAASSPQSYVWQILIRLHCDWFRRRYRKVAAGIDSEGKPRFRYLLKESRGSEIEVEGTEWFDLDNDDPVVDQTFEQLENADLRDCFGRASQTFLQAHPGRAVYVELHVVAQMSDGEIAAAIGRTKHATAQFLSQCRKLFIEILQRMCGPDAARPVDAHA
jgi:RNA polymerase sigma factor (sigma-70 family)